MIAPKSGCPNHSNKTCISGCVMCELYMSNWNTLFVCIYMSIIMGVAEASEQITEEKLCMYISGSKWSVILCSQTPDVETKNLRYTV